MIRLIFHQIWNQRRQNLWIWLELMVLSVFIWMVMGPLFTMVCIKHHPANFDTEHTCTVMPVYSRFGPRYKAEADNDSCYKLQLQLLLTQLSVHPMVEAVCICEQRSVPCTDWWYEEFFYPDKAACEKDREQSKGDYAKMTGASCLWFPNPYVEGLEQWSDMSYVLGLRDAATGKYFHTRPDAAKQYGCYISAKAARLLYGTECARGCILFETVTGKEMRVEGVFMDIKQRDFIPPSPNIMLSLYTNDLQYSLKNCGALVRLKAGVGVNDFRRAVRMDIFPECRIGNTVRFEVISRRQDMNRVSEVYGANNVIRLHLALGGFGLLCVFLSVTGLFWVRCIGRRQDMGLMRSMGATRLGVVRQMLCESVLLFVLAFVPAMFLVVVNVYLNGYDCGLFYKPDPDFWFLRTVPHVSAVTLLSFLFMLIIILLATWIPVYHASRTIPSDALRDE